MYTIGVLPSPNKGKKKNHTRTKAKRTIASVNQRTLEGTPSKRGREEGGTPPSAHQPNKKIDNILKPPAKQKQSFGFKNNVDESKQSNDSVPPAPEQGQSIGSEENALASSSLPNAQAPPVSNIEQSTGSEANPINLTDNEDETYASVSKLCKCIIDQRQPDSMTLLNQQRFDILNSQLIDLMMSQMCKNITLPEIDDARLHIGTMRIRCTNPSTIDWLVKYVPTIGEKKLWKGAKLVVIDFKDIPKPYKFNVWIRGIKKSPKDIFMLLEKQNPNRGITTKSWTVLHSKFENGGTSMTIGVGHESFEFLQQNPNSLYSVYSGQRL